MGIMTRGGIVFCLVDGLLGFACSNDCFVGTLFFIPFLFVADLRKLQNTNVKKETCQYLPLQMSTCSEEINVREMKNYTCFLNCDLVRNLHCYLVHIPLSPLDVRVLEAAYKMVGFVFLVV
jgi:hypothetical protein